jgi:hypothetical protein
MGGTAQTILFVEPVDTRIGAADQKLLAAASSKLPVSFVSATPNICAIVNGSRLIYIHAISAGSCSVSAVQDGNAAFSTAPTIVAVFNVLAANDVRKIVTFDPNGGVFDNGSANPMSMIYSGSALTLPHVSNGTMSFGHWHVGDINGSDLGAVSNYSPSSDVVIVAKWA